jgi:hypothetical protein
MVFIATKHAPSRGLALGHGSDFARGCSSTSFRRGVGYVGQVGASFGLATRLLGAKSNPPRKSQDRSGASLYPVDERELIPTGRAYVMK